MDISGGRGETYPSGFQSINTYDSFSNLIAVKDKNNKLIWEAVAENARGQMTDVKKGGRLIKYGFDDRGLPTSIKSDNIVDLAYGFDNELNLEYRIEKHNTLSGQAVTHREDFKYDDLNRLYQWEITQSGASTAAKTSNIVYNPNTGTITSKSDLGGYTFGYGIDNTKPHALSSISGVPSGFPQPSTAYPSANLDVTYTDFKKIKTLSEMGKTYELTYGVDDQRRKSIYKENGVTKLTRYYVGDYEEEIDALGNVRQIHYLSGAIMILANGVETLYFSYTDHQGSLIAMTNENGTVIERYAYDPWGARRNPDNWTENDSRTTWIVNRGYTGHEHLDAFGIINMNGRVYDPLTAMFFSPDPYVQAPDKWLNYNRYGYCYGNPFRYTDPSGEWIHLLIGFVVGGVFNWVSHGCQFNQNGLLAFGIGGVGGLIAAATGGASLAGTAGAAFATGGGGLLAGAGLAGSAYCANTMFTSFGNAIAFGDPIPTGSEMMQGLVTSMVTAGLLQGVNASINGRNFWNGKVIPQPVKFAMPPTGVTLKTTNPDEMVAASKSQQVKMSDMPSNGAATQATAQSETLPMQGKVMNTVKGPDGKVNIVFESKVKYLGRLEDLKGIPRNQTILDELPDLGSPKANYYQNMSVIRRNLREGVTFKDASWFRPNSELAPTLSWPTRTVGQTFYGAERNLMQNRGLWPK